MTPKPPSHTPPYPDPEPEPGPDPDHTDPDASAPRRTPRWIRVPVYAMLVLMALSGLLLVSVVVTGPQRADRAYARSVTAMATGAGRVIASLLGEASLDGDDLNWRGLRRYDPSLGAWVVLSEHVADQAGLADPDPLDPLTAPGASVVLLVHGLDEPGSIWDQLAPALAGAGHTPVRFDYANDQPIADSAAQLLTAMGTLRARGVTRVDLVCHSMGGLVARDAITRDNYDALGPRVDQMITLGTPFAGSPWARLRALAEVREQVQRWAQSDDMDPRRLLGFARDGVGQAGRDLMPGSQYLTQLAARPFPQTIRVTCVVGRAAPDPDAVSLGALIADQALDDLLGQEDAGVIRRELTRLGNELGDGVVPVSSAAMDGAHEVVLVNANHRAMIRTIELGQAIRAISALPPDDPPPGIEIVLDRLSRDEGPPGSAQPASGDRAKP